MLLIFSSPENPLSFIISTGKLTPGDIQSTSMVTGQAAAELG